MTSTFSWVDLASLVVGVAALCVTIAIFLLGRRISFRQQREHVRELQAKAWEVLGPIRTEGLNSKIIVMNVARYQHGYDGSNELTWRGYAYTGPEIIEIVHGGVEVIIKGAKSYYTSDGRRTLTSTGMHAIESGHIPWSWIEDIDPRGDEFDGSAIFFVRHSAPGRMPYDYITYREGAPVSSGPNNRDYYRPLRELGTRRPRVFHDWRCFAKRLVQARRMRAASAWVRDDA